jgi:hypothetical protein
MSHAFLVNGLFKKMGDLKIPHKKLQTSFGAGLARNWRAGL